MFDAKLKVDDADWLEAEIARLTARPYPVIGVPMYLTTEDLTLPATSPMVSDAENDRLAEAFDKAVETLQARRGPLGPRDITHVVEVLAEHSFLDLPFSGLGEAPDTAPPEP